ncbi:MAG: hypothetical protein AB1813_12305 [Verrucomicrobiota bacterium]
MIIGIVLMRIVRGMVMVMWVSLMSLMNDLKLFEQGMRCHHWPGSQQQQRNDSCQTTHGPNHGELRQA